MRSLTALLSMLALAGLPAIAHGPTIDFFFVPDIPQDLPLVAPPETTSLPWLVVRHDVPSPYTSTVTPALPVPFAAQIDALHLQNNGDWLLSVAAPTDFAPFVPGTTAQPGDVVIFDGATYDHFFCAGAFGLPPEADVDAVFLTTQKDIGDLVVSFATPTDIAGTTYLPADLVLLKRVGPLCFNWAVSGYYFDSVTEFALSGAGQVPTFPNVTGADERGTRIVLTFQEPTDLVGTTYLPGELVAYDPGPKIFTLFHADPGVWNVRARMNAFSLLAPPGRIPGTGNGVKLELMKAGGGQITLTWSASCSVGAEDYGFYEGTLPPLASAWAYNHTSIGCTDTGAPFTETIAPGASHRFYLVVPNNPNDEGSYGLDLTTTGAMNERPQGAAPCEATQELGCP